MTRSIALSIAALSTALLLACGSGENEQDSNQSTENEPKNPSGQAANPNQKTPDASEPKGNDESASNGVAERFGLKKGFSGMLAIDGGLNNPSDISFDQIGTPTIVDSGNGRVILLRDGEVEEYITGFATEHWKPNAFKLGPLSAVWVNDGPIVVEEPVLAVTDGGAKDGEEKVYFYTQSGKAYDTGPNGPSNTNPVAEGGGEGWTNEGNLSGMSVDDLGERMYVCGQGSDDVTVVLEVNTATFEMKPLLSADEHGIAVNSPMETVITDDGHLLVLYSGTGGVADGLMVLWDLETKQPLVQYDLGAHGIVDPMSMALVPGTEATYAVVDNNWALDTVKRGTLSLVTLMADGQVEVEVIADKMEGPVACAFDSEARLWITQLGPAFDQNQGNLLVIDGLGE